MANKFTIAAALVCLALSVVITMCRRVKAYLPLAGSAM
jgi:hypothetical protein